MTDKLGPKQTPNVTQLGGHYAQAMVHGDLVYLSVRLGFDPGSSTPELVSVGQQVRNFLANLSAILDEAGSNMDHVIRTIFDMSDIAVWPEVNAIYADVFGDHRPVRTIVPCNTLHHGFQIEIDALAVMKS